MGSEWTSIRLDEATTKLGDGLHGTPEYSLNGEYFFINGNNLSNGQILFNDKTKRVGRSQYEKLKKKLTNRTLLVSINGTIGNIAYYDDEKVVLGKSACYFNVKEDISKRFIRYVLQSHLFQNYIESFSTGTTIKNVSLKTMREFSFSLPCFKEQERIGNILHYLDNKIQLNQQTNQTLEAMAQALFKSWFVDFDPVIDNVLAAGKTIPEPFQKRAEQRAQQHAAAKPSVAALPDDIRQHFPCEFEHTEELGWVPLGWKVKPLEDLVEIASSKRVFAKDYTSEGVPFFRGKEISELSQGNKINTEIFISEEKYTELKLKAGAPKGGDILITSVGTIGNTYLVKDTDKFYFKDGNLTWIKSYKKDIIPHFIIEWLRSKGGKEAIERIKIGTTQQAITIKGLNKIPALTPSSKILELYENSCKGFYIKQSANIVQINSLSQLRDTLIPKLISGELRLPPEPSP